MSAVAETPLRFELPPQLEAGAPPEALGRSRDDVRLLASHRRSGDHLHTRFRELPLLLSPGDLVVLNTSATLPAAVPARRPNGEEIELRYSGGDLVELRRFEGDTTVPLLDAHAGELLELPAYAGARLLRRHDGSRLWRARLALGGATLVDYLHRHGHPIRYAYAQRAWLLTPTRRCTPRSRAAPRCRARGARLHPRAAARTGRAGDRGRPARAAHRRVVAGDRRAPGAGAVPRARRHRGSRQLGARRRPPRGRRRHDRDPGAGDRHPARRPRPWRRGHDRAGDRARRRAACDRRPADRLARAAQHIWRC